MPGDRLCDEAIDISVRRCMAALALAMTDQIMAA
jgi:hypothetical protein